MQALFFCVREEWQLLAPFFKEKGLGTRLLAIRNFNGRNEGWRSSDSIFIKTASSFTIHACCVVIDCSVAAI